VTVHEFQKSLSVSKQNTEASYWLRLYDAFFPGRRLGGIHDITDRGQQLAGIDRELVLKGSGKVLMIDEKVRSRSNCDDILLEYWSNYQAKVPGWIEKDLLCDYVCYLFEPVKRAYLLPFDLLRRAWIVHKSEWITQYPEVRAENADYTTISVAIPIHVLMNSLVAAMVAENW
jgi:hypothetical protein